MKMKMSLWLRVICGLLALAGIAALVANVWNGTMDSLWRVLEWLLAAWGTWIFGVTAVRKQAVPRPVEALPAPSSQVEQLLAAGQSTDAIKAYRAQAGASLIEARAVLAHYWPDGTAPVA